MSETLFVHGDFKAPCLVWRSGDDVEVTLTAVRPPDIAALMHAMKTVCGSRECRLVAGGVETQMMCLRVEGRERIHTLAGGVEFVLSLRALPRLDVAVCGETCGTLTCTEPKGHAGLHRDGRQSDCYPWSQADCDRKPAPPEWNTLKIGGVPAPAHCGDKLGPLTCMCAKGHEGAHRDGLNVWYARDGYNFTVTRPSPRQRYRSEVLPAAKTEGPPDCACGRYVGEAHAPGCSVRAAEERRQREAPLVALVAAVPEGLDPIGWMAAAISTDEAFVRMPSDERPHPGDWGHRLTVTLRVGVPRATEGTWMHAALTKGRDAYRRALTRQPPPMRPGRVLACNAYDVPGQP